MRKFLLVAVALAVLGGTASAGEVICGKDWISFEPLSPEAFSEEPGLNSYLVRKSDIRRGNAAVRGPLSQFGYLMLTPLEGDALEDRRIQGHAGCQSGDPGVLDGKRALTPTPVARHGHTAIPGHDRSSPPSKPSMLGLT